MSRPPITKAGARPRQESADAYLHRKAKYSDTYKAISRVGVIISPAILSLVDVLSILLLRLCIMREENARVLPVPFFD